MKIWSTVALMVFMQTSGAYAADDDGKFAAKGAARKSCADFVQAQQTKSRDYYLFGGWLEGYITAYNQFQKDTYDITPWQTTELLLALTAHHCKDNPNTRLLNVTSGLIKTLTPLRLSKESPVVKLNIADHDSYYYSEVIKMVKSRLKQLGVYQGDITSDTYAAAEITAMRAFQLRAGIRGTGIPDQQTLVQRFLRFNK